MPRLTLPSSEVRESFLAAVEEFSAEGREIPHGDTGIGGNPRSWAETWGTPEGFAAFVAALKRAADDAAPQPPERVASTTWWWIEGSEFLGRVSFRHRLTPALREVGGHLGYEVRASARRRGHATAMLADALPLVGDYGVDPARITCAVDNIASRRVIESNGGVLDDEYQGRLRFWVPTGTSGTHS